MPLVVESVNSIPCQVYVTGGAGLLTIALQVPPDLITVEVPVLLFHGTVDRNVSVEQSKLMAARLKSAGGNVDLVVFEDLDHYLQDSQVREQMLRKSDEFIRHALGM